MNYTEHRMSFLHWLWFGQRDRAVTFESNQAVDLFCFLHFRLIEFFSEENISEIFITAYKSNLGCKVEEMKKSISEKKEAIPKAN